MLKYSRICLDICYAISCNSHAPYISMIVKSILILQFNFWNYFAKEVLNKQAVKHRLCD